ncbi:[acyl-carrier-protein] S-malonyltransferase [Raineyella antarctica]|uniref:[acyl-carrier-protein] S-malonyltransferase n=1 Tax=Raineyella antarctica TaxID=1577474 RepID=A0A1G6GWH0_9ACTN|nr:acyltransferase domain-containing protein [Raineyella antarctica]SDB86228.1 [acyl-carrier-protein] S-malonyltransferase [Raineyella antarctica]
MLAVVAPGQGAQKPGFLEPWLADPVFADRLNWLSAVSGLDLEYYGTQADEATIRDTAIAQPLLVAAGLVSALALFRSPADAFRQVGVVAGHSVGELTAAAAVGVLSAEQAMVLVRERGKAMAEASALRPTSMAAVIGGKEDEVLAAIEAAGLTPANHNGSGQIVAAGTVEQIEVLKENAPARTRVIPLSVAGAFHTHHMAPATARLERLARAITTHDPRIRLLQNRDGHVVQSGQDMLQRLVAQVEAPVRWDLCMDSMRDLGVTGMIEMPPAGTLTGIAKRNLKGVEVFALNTPDELPAAREFVARHADPGTTVAQASTPTWRLVVSPTKGEFRATEGLRVGDALARGTEIGTVSNLRESVPVLAVEGGSIVEWAVEDHDPVSPGQPLLRLHPTTENTDATEVTR